MKQNSKGNEKKRSYEEKKTASKAIEEKMESNGSGSYQSSNNKSSSHSLSSSTKGISVTRGGWSVMEVQGVLLRGRRQSSKSPCVGVSVGPLMGAIG